MKVLYLTYENVYRTAILQAMVIKPLSILHQKYGVDFVITSSLKNNEEDEIYKINKTETNETYPYLDIIEFKKNLTDSQSVITYCRDILPVFYKCMEQAKDADLIHCRSYGACLIGLMLKFLTRKKIIFDMRGLLPEETIDVGKLTSDSFKYNLLKKVEKFLIKYSDYIIVVSEKFKEYIRHNFSRNNILNIYNPTDFTEYKTTKHFDRINFIYSGSMQPWHLPELTIKYYSELSKHYKSRIHLYFCTNDNEKAKKIFTDYNIRQEYYTLQSLPFEQMKNIYQKAHIGFCFIKESLSKSVCFPVKFSEYIASNIYTLVNNNIGDLATIVSQNNCGLVFSDLNDLHNNIIKIQSLVESLMKHKTSFDRNKISYLDWNSGAIDKIYNIYKDLCNISESAAETNIPHLCRQDI